MKGSSKPPSGTDKNASEKPVLSEKLVRARIRKGLTQTQLADLVGIHRNSVQNLERGITRRVAPSVAAGLAKALNTTIEELELRVRPPSPPSIRMRQLNPEQRTVVEDLLNLPPADFDFIRKTLAILRERNAEPTPPKRGPKPRR